MKSYDVTIEKKLVAITFTWYTIDRVLVLIFECVNAIYGVTILMRPLAVFFAKTSHLVCSSNF